MFRLQQILVPAMLLLLAACSKTSTNEKGKQIPKDAALVMHVDLKSLSGKITLEDLKATSFYKEALIQAKDSLATQLMQNPAQSGVDMSSDLFIVMHPHKEYGRHMVFMAGMKDAAAFEKMLVKIPENTGVKKEKAFSYSTMRGGDGQLVAWTANRLIAITEMPEESRRSRRYDWDKEEGGAEKEKQPAGKSKTSLEYLQYLFDLGTSGSLGGDERFGKMMEEKGDMHVYVNLAGVMEAAGEDAASEMPFNMAGFQNKMTADNYAAITLSLDAGKINMSMSQYFSSAMRNLYKKYNNGNLDAASFAKIPVKNPALAVGVKFDTRFIPALIKELGVGDMLRMVEGQGGMTIAEMTKGLSGDFSFVLGNLMSPEAVQALRQRITAKLDKGGDEQFDVEQALSRPFDFFVTAGVGDEQAFKKLSVLAGIGKKMGGDEDSPGLTMETVGKNFVVASGKELLESYRSGSGGSAPAFTAEFSKHPLGIYVNLQQLMPYFYSRRMFDEESPADSAAVATMNMFREIYMVGGNFEGKAMVYKGWLSLADGGTNAGKQLLALADRLFVMNQQTEAMRDKAWLPAPDAPTEMVAPPPPPDEEPAAAPRKL